MSRNNKHLQKNASAYTADSSITHKEGQRKRELEQEDMYELLASIGIPFGPDGEPVGID